MLVKLVEKIVLIFLKKKYRKILKTNQFRNNCILQLYKTINKNKYLIEKLIKINIK